MTLAEFKRAAGLSSRKADNAGFAYMTIHTTWTENAAIGLQHGDITQSQHDKLLEQRDNLLNKIRF